MGIDEFHRAQVRSALLALVAIGVLVMAVGALPDDIAVGEELAGFLVVELFGFLFHQLSVVVELAEEV